MKRTGRTLALVLLLLTARPGGTREDPQDVPWPSQSSRRITSNFAEPRGRRFHAGVDISTLGRQGYDLFAPAGGWIKRIGASYYGYGKQLLIAGDDGREYLFAHLLDFSPEVEDYLEARQLKDMEYHQTLYPPRGRFRVGRGELVGRSGSSGSGPPHLHFEVRDGNGFALNPLTHGLGVPDRRTPVIQELAVFAADEGVLIDGSPLPAVMRVERLKSGSYRLPDTLRISGPVRFALRCYDRVNGSRSRLAPYRLLLRENGDTLYHGVYDRVPFAQNSQIAGEVNRWLLEERERVFRNLWPAPGDLPFCRDALQVPGEEPGNGIVDPGWWVHPDATVEIRCADVRGNEARLTVALLYGDSALGGWTLDEGLFLQQPAQGRSEVLPEPATWWNGGALSLSFEWPERLESLHVDAGIPLSAPLLKGALKPGGVTHFLFLDRGVLAAERVRVGFPLRTPEQALWIDLRGFLHPGGTAVSHAIPRPPVNGALSASDITAGGGESTAKGAAGGRSGTRGAALLELHPGTLLRDEFVIARWLDPGGDTLEIGPPQLPVAEAGRLWMPWPQAEDSLRGRMGICRRERDEWKWCGAQSDEYGLSCPFTQPGRYLVLADTLAPRLRAHKPGRRSSAERPVFVWECREDLSGVVRVELWIDGEPALPRFDPDTERILYRPRKPLERGTKNLLLRVEDRCGNVAEHRRRIRLR